MTLRLTRLPGPLLLGFASIFGGLVLWTAVVHSGLLSSKLVPSPFELLAQTFSLLSGGYVGTSLQEDLNGGSASRQRLVMQECPSLVVFRAQHGRVFHQLVL